MKNKIKFSLVFGAGFILGALTIFIILGQISYLTYRDFFMRSAKEQIFIASELRANRQHDLRERAEANLPDIVLSIHKDRSLQNAPDAGSVLRGVRDFYEINSLPIPEEISGILSGMPKDH